MAWLAKYELIPYHTEEAELSRRPRSTAWSICWYFVGLTGLTLVCCGSFILGRSSVTTAQCDRKLSTWSPALEVVEYHQVMFDGAFLAPSPWRGAPSSQVDEAWDNITLGGTRNMRIKPSDLHLLNKTKNDRTEFIYSDGEEGQAVVMLEVFHHLHCLNELRKRTWPIHYPLPEDKVNRAHIDHCIEMLRISIMCQSDVTPITLYVPEWQDDPTPDFSTLHTCRNFEKILDYVKDNTMEYSLPDLS